MLSSTAGLVGARPDLVCGAKFEGKICKRKEFTSSSSIDECCKGVTGVTKARRGKDIPVIAQHGAQRSTYMYRRSLVKCSPEFCKIGNKLVLSHSWRLSVDNGCEKEVKEAQNLVLQQVFRGCSVWG